MRTIINCKDNRSINTELTNAQLCEEFGKYATDDHWLWYFMAQYVEEQRKIPTESRLQTVEMMSFLGDNFLFAIGMGLLRPMIRVHSEGRRYKIYLSQRGTLCFKSGALVHGTNDPDGDEQYMGCLTRGKFLPTDSRVVLDQELMFIAKLTIDPVGFLAQASKDMSRCCYCYKALEDVRSKDVGYGATCAQRWGLPWGKSYDEKVPSFAQLWSGQVSSVKRDIRGICKAIRTNPYDDLNWAVLGDALNECGYEKRPSAPARRVVVPNV